MRAMLAAMLAICLPFYANAAGLQWPVTVADPGAPPLQVAIWYPSHDPSARITIDDQTMNVARDGAMFGTHHPLIVFSHGVFGSAFNNFDTAIALADAGFIVAAVTHTNDNNKDSSGAFTASNIAARPRHISRTIDALTTSWGDHGAIDSDHIGIFGYSAGGGTALLTIGGRADMGQLGKYCHDHGSDYLCVERKRRALNDDDEPIIITGYDARIKAAVLAAPALASTFMPDGLKNVTVPLQVWLGSQDTIIRGFDFSRTGLPYVPDVRLVENASHASFMPPCTGLWGLLGRGVCKDVGGFDRAAFHQLFNQSVIAFFRLHLAQQ